MLCQKNSRAGPSGLRGSDVMGRAMASGESSTIIRAMSRPIAVAVGIHCRVALLDIGIDAKADGATGGKPTLCVEKKETRPVALSCLVFLKVVVAR